MGRKPLSITGYQIQSLAAIGCPVTEMADFFGCHPNTLLNRFGPEIKRGQGELALTLRRLQYEVAMRRNTRMLIFLWRVYEQSD
jgi:hypothetical protein